MFDKTYSANSAAVQAVWRFIKSQGGSVGKWLNVINGASAQFTESILAAIEAMEGVQTVEQDGPVTTMAVGEEDRVPVGMPGVHAVGKVGPGGDMQWDEQPQATTFAIGEEDRPSKPSKKAPVPSKKAPVLSKKPPPAGRGKPQITTKAIGEEGGPTRSNRLDRANRKKRVPAEPVMSTMAIGEEGPPAGPTTTTKAIGEEGTPAEPVMSTMAIGEEGPPQIWEELEADLLRVSSDLYGESSPVDCCSWIIMFHKGLDRNSAAVQAVFTRIEQEGGSVGQWMNIINGCSAQFPSTAERAIGAMDAVHVLEQDAPVSTMAIGEENGGGLMAF